MGLRFRRTWSVIPGVRFNLGLRGGSVSFGTRGLHYTVGTSGSRITAGLPGTGLFWTQKLKSPFGSAPPGQGTQPRSYLSPPGGGAQPFGGRQAQTFSPPPRIAPTSSQLRQPSMPLPSSNLAGLSPAPTHRHVFVPMWLVWSVFAVILIGVLCLGAAVAGALLR
jgi:Protein of unknown function (DUF4236)